MESQSSNSESNEGVLLDLESLFSLSDITEGLDILSERMVSVCDSILGEMNTLDGLLREGRSTCLASRYASMLPIVGFADFASYSSTPPGLSTMPDYSSFEEIVTSGNFFFI